MQLNVEIIDSLQGLEDVRQQWQQLYECCPWATPFQSPDWLIPWWKQLGSGRLCTLAAYADQQLVGLAPLYLHDKEALFVGTGISDYLDFLAMPEFGRQAELFLERLMSLSDTCRLQEIRGGSPLLDIKLPGVRITSAQLSICPFVDLPSESGEYLAIIAPPLRRTLRRATQKMHPYRMEKAGPQAVPAFMEKLFLLHASRWRERNLPGVLDHAQIQSYHREVAEMFASKGCLGLYGLWCRGRLAAVLYSFRKGRRTYAYLSGFDPELEDLSPGALLIYHVIESSIREGIREFDFLRGNEKYKYLWGARARHTFALEISRN